MMDLPHEVVSTKWSPQQLEWAGSWNIMLMRAGRANDRIVKAGAILDWNNRENGLEHFICPHTYKHFAKLIRVDVVDGGSFIVRRPVEHVNSTDLILGAYHNCVRDGDNIDVAFQVVS